MKKYLPLIMTAAVALAACAEQQPKEKVIGRSEPAISTGRLDANILNSFGRISDPQVSPDGNTILYGVTYQSIEDNKSNRELFVVNIDGSGNKQITATAKGEGNARWFDGGKKIAYLAGGQLWAMNADGSHQVQLSNYEGGIVEFMFSPDEQKILFISEVNAIKRPADIYPDLPKATARIIDDLMYRHWDQWVENIPHPFVADFDGKGLTNIFDILDGEPYEAPTLPFGGMEQLAWSPDGKIIAYASRKKTGRDYAFSTNTDIYLFDVASRIHKNITEGMPGYDTQPLFSPDGKYIAWASMERDGYEADKNRFFIMDLATGEKIYLTEKYDNNVNSFCWAPDSKSLYMQSDVKGAIHLFEVTVADKTIRQITGGLFDYGSPVLAANNKMVTTRQSISMPTELFVVDKTNGEATQVTFENKHLLDRLTMGEVKSVWLKTTDNKQMQSWVIYPPNFDPNKKYPALLYCQGGPQGPLSQFWSYRWNFQLMAANDYIVIAPHRRGVTGYGQEWVEQISGDYSGQNMRDYFTAIDYLKNEPYVDENRLGAVGASYGGYSVYWLAGNHNKRFKAFIAHCGIFNLEQMSLTTEETFFVKWDNGGLYWEKNNPVAMRSYANSPHKFVDQWDTPIMVIHGERDFRVPFEQGMAAFNAARMRNLPAEMLLFPDENHWILKPQNNVLWHRSFYAWLDKWLK